MKAYKLVTLRNKKYLSYCANVLPVSFCARYEIGKKTFPVVGKLFACETKEILECYHRGAKGTRILLCEVQAAEEQPDCSICAADGEEEILAFWKAPNLYPKRFPFQKGDQPLFCDWIEPIKEITLDEIES